VVKPPLPDQYATYKQWCVALAREGKNAREIKATTGCSNSYAYDAIASIKKAEIEAGEKATPTDVKIQEVQAEDEDIPIAQEKPEGEETEEAEEDEEEAEDLEEEEGEEHEAPEVPAYAKSLLTGVVDADDCEGLWSNVNDLFPENHRRPQGSIRALGKLSVRPFTRIIVKYAGEWGDLIFLGIVVIVTFAPSVKGVAGEWMESRKTQKERKKEVKP